MPTLNRKDYDPLVTNEVGEPIVVHLIAGLGAVVAASTTGYDRWGVPASFVQRFSAGRGFSIAEVSVHIATADAGDRTTGSYNLLLKKLDSAGNASTIATLTFVVTASTEYFGTFDLRDAKTKTGLALKPGESLRLDTAAVMTGGATCAKNIKVRIAGKVYGIIT